MMAKHPGEIPDHLRIWFGAGANSCQIFTLKPGNNLSLSYWDGYLDSFLIE
jgi:hypothetical protein